MLVNFSPAPLAIAGQRNFEDISSFIHKKFSLCKQHIYIYENKSGMEKASHLIVDGFEEIAETREKTNISKTFLVKHQVDVILRKPLEELTVDFVLPVRFDFRSKHFLVRFVTFERDLHALFKGRNVVLPRQSEKEKAYLKIIETSARNLGINITTIDLHKGVKTLWHNGYMDTPRIKYKTADSVDTKAMDDRKGLRENNPEAYDKIKDESLHATLFEVAGKDGAPPVLLTIDPPKGFISFGRYAEDIGDSDDVVHEILRHNE